MPESGFSLFAGRLHAPPMRALVILSLQVKRQGDAKDKLNLTPDFTFSGWRQDQTRSSTFLTRAHGASGPVLLTFLIVLSNVYCAVFSHTYFVCPTHYLFLKFM